MPVPLIDTGIGPHFWKQSNFFSSSLCALIVTAHFLTCQDHISCSHHFGSVHVCVCVNAHATLG